MGKATPYGGGGGGGGKPIKRIQHRGKATPLGGGEAPRWSAILAGATLLMLQNTVVCVGGHCLFL